MTKLLFVLFILLFLSFQHAFSLPDNSFTEIHGDGKYTVAQKKDADAKAEIVSREIDRASRKELATKVNTVLRAIYHVGFLNLRRHGYFKDAVWLRDNWRKHDGEIIKLVETDRPIGDFEPISAFLALSYEVLELKLGLKLCYILRLSDIKTLNYATWLVLGHPCLHGEEEFRLHFIHDDKYRGLAPVLTYWLTVIPCSIATFGAGYFFVCSPIAMLAEVVMDWRLAPYLAPRIYARFCHFQATGQSLSQQRLGAIDPLQARLLF